MASEIGEIVNRMSEAADERRSSSRLDQRADVDRLVRLADHLPPGERAIILGVYEAGLGATQLGHLMDANPRTIRRRLRGIERRVRDPIFAFVLAHRSQWTAERRRVAESRWLHGRSIRDITRATGVSLHRVRRHVDAVQAQYEAIKP